MDVTGGEKERLSKEIDKCGRKIAEYEDAYNSLVRFKETVTRTRGSFAQATSQSRMILTNLDKIKTNTPPADTYTEGMSYTLSGIGMQTVDHAFGGLMLMIEAKKTQYLIEIEFWNTRREVQLGELYLLNSLAANPSSEQEQI